MYQIFLGSKLSTMAVAFLLGFPAGRAIEFDNARRYLNPFLGS